MKYNDAILRPRYEETDQMGVVYHGNYYRYFETGRSEFFRSLGYSYSDLEKQGVILPIIESGCKHIKPALYDEELIIRTRIVKLKGVRMEFNYTVIRKETDEVLAEGRTAHAFVDSDLKPVRYKNLPEEFTKILEDYLD